MPAPHPPAAGVIDDPPTQLPSPSPPANDKSKLVYRSAPQPPPPRESHSSASSLTTASTTAPTMPGPQSPAASLASRTRHHAAGAYSYAQRSLDRFVEPEARRKAYDDTYAFASARPFVFSAATALALFSALPLLIFGVFVVSAVAISVGGGILFALFWFGVGVLALIPTLFATTFLAVLVWSWAACSFLVARALYRAVSSWDSSAVFVDVRRTATPSKPLHLREKAPAVPVYTGTGQESAVGRAA